MDSSLKFDGTNDSSTGQQLTARDQNHTETSPDELPVYDAVQCCSKSLPLRRTESKKRPSAGVAVTKLIHQLGNTESSVPCSAS